MEGPQEIWNFSSPKLQDTKKILASTNKIFVVGGVYTMESKDTNTDYQKVFRVVDQKWEIVEITTGTFFCLRFVFTIFIQAVFTPT